MKYTKEYSVEIAWKIMLPLPKDSTCTISSRISAKLLCNENADDERSGMYLKGRMRITEEN